MIAFQFSQNSSQTNAAIGSNLSLSGTVECDASIMDGQGNFGAVGAVKGDINGIRVVSIVMLFRCIGHEYNYRSGESHYTGTHTSKGEFSRMSSSRSRPSIVRTK